MSPTANPWRLVLLSVCLVSSATFSGGDGSADGDDAAPERPRLELSGASAFTCDAVEGELIVLVSLEWGALAISAEPFVGSTELGRIEGSAIHFSFPGLRMPELRIDGRSNVPDGSKLWGRRIAAADRLKGSPGCAGMDRPETDAALAKGVHDLTGRILAGES